MFFSLLFGLLPYWNHTNIGYSSSGWYIFLKVSGHISCYVGTLIPNKSEFIVCLSVCYLAYLHSEIKNIDYSSSGWYIILKFLGDTLETFIHYFPIILIFLCVCQSVSWLTFLLKLDKYRHISGPEWDIFLKFFRDISGKDSGNVRSG